MLSENKLAEQAEMSRTPIRAALSTLQEDGWIQIFPKRGALVREMTLREAEEIVDARILLECMGARRADNGTLAVDLSDILERQREDEKRGDRLALIDNDVLFHRRIASGIGNSILTEFYDRLRTRQALLVSHSFSSLDRREEILLEHAELIGLLANKDLARFALTLEAHLRRTVSVVYP